MVISKFNPYKYSKEVKIRKHKKKWMIKIKGLPNLFYASKEIMFKDIDSFFTDAISFKNKVKGKHERKNKC